MAKTKPVSFKHFVALLMSEVGAIKFKWVGNDRVIVLDPKQLPSAKMLHKQIKRALKAADWSKQGKEFFPCTDGNMNENLAWYVARFHHKDQRSTFAIQDMVGIECGGTAAAPYLTIHHS